MINSFEKFLLENSQDVLTAEEVVTYIKDITPNDSDVPDFFFSQVLKSQKKFKRERVKIADLLKADPSFKEYVDGKEERYGEDSESSHEPHPDDYGLPIVVFNGEVVDGYSRGSGHYHSGEEFIEAYVSQ